MDDTDLQRPDPPPELTLIRIAEVVARWMPGEASLASRDAMDEVATLVQQAGVPFPRSEAESEAIREGYQPPALGNSL